MRSCAFLVVVIVVLGVFPRNDGTLALSLSDEVATLCYMFRHYPPKTWLTSPCGLAVPCGSTFDGIKCSATTQHVTSMYFCVLLFLIVKNFRILKNKAIVGPMLNSVVNFTELTYLFVFNTAKLTMFQGI